MKKSVFARVILSLVITILIAGGTLVGRAKAPDLPVNLPPFDKMATVVPPATAAAGKNQTTSGILSPNQPPTIHMFDDASEAVGKVIDDDTKQPLVGALVTINGKEVGPTDSNGTFPIPNQVTSIAARALGYSRAEVSIHGQLDKPHIELHLVPIRPKALYLTVYGIGSKVLRNDALALIDKTNLNALVIDMKGDRGMIPYRSAIPMASAIGAIKVKTVDDIKELIRSLKAKGIYTIARIVVFKDNLLGIARPDLAVKTADGQLWRDREQLVWVNPSRREVWDYNIEIAIEAAQNGFDEIQFDYIRFPDHKGLKFGIANTEENRVGSVTGFLKEARRRLQEYNVFISADIFGYVPWNYDDTQIGQRIDRLVPIIDYISPMLYPSGFHLGIPGYRNPIANPYKIVFLTLKKAQERTRLPSICFRPWLQSFKDYAYDRRLFTGVEIREQIKAAEDFGADGWMLWNPRNIYSADGLQKR